MYDENFFSVGRGCTYCLLVINSISNTLPSDGPYKSMAYQLFFKHQWSVCERASTKSTDILARVKSARVFGLHSHQLTTNMVLKLCHSLDVKVSWKAGWTSNLNGLGLKWVSWKGLVFFWLFIYVLSFQKKSLLLCSRELSLAFFGPFNPLMLV